VKLSDVTVGTQLPPFVVESVGAQPMKVMAALLRDPNPIHFDPVSVRALGMGDRVVNQGPINHAYLVNMLTRFAGDPAAIREMTVRFMGNVFAGDRVECEGTVADIDRERGLVTVELAQRVGDTQVLDGSAVIALPG